MASKHSVFESLFKNVRKVNAAAQLNEAYIYTQRVFITSFCQKMKYFKTFEKYVF